MSFLHELYPLGVEKHKDVVASINVNQDMLSFLLAYRTEEGLGISALFAVDVDAASTPLRELPDYHELVKGYAIEDRGYKITFGPIVFELQTRNMSENAKRKLRSAVVEQRLMQLAEQDRFLAITINGSGFNSTSVLPFIYSVTPAEYEAQKNTRKKMQVEARLEQDVVPGELLQPDEIRDTAWYQRNTELFEKLYVSKSFASQHNIQYRNRVLAWMLNNWELKEGGRVDGIPAFLSVLELAEKFGMTQKTIAEKERDYMARLSNNTGSTASYLKNVQQVPQHKRII